MVKIILARIKDKTNSTFRRYLRDEYHKEEGFISYVVDDALVEYLSKRGYKINEEQHQQQEKKEKV